MEVPRTMPGTAPIRVLLCDDSASIRHLYRLLLSAEPDIEVVGEANDGVDVVHQVSELQPQVVVLDVAMPVRDGLDAIPDITEACNDVRIVMCTAMVGDSFRRRARELGAVEYITKGTDPNVLIEAIRRHGHVPDPGADAASNVA